MSSKYFLCVVIALCLNTALFSEEPDKNLHNKCLYPTVLIHTGVIAGDAFINQGSGSGVIISSVPASSIFSDKFINVVLTCNHVAVNQSLGTIENKFGARFVPDTFAKVGVSEYENWSKFKEYTWFDAKLYGAYEDHDLAILIFISDNQMPVADINFNPEIYIGSHVIKVGCGLGDQPRVEFGRVTSLNPSQEHDRTKGTNRLSVMSLPGDSGGPVFHENKVIGIVSMIRIAQGIGAVFDISYMQPLAHFEKWIKEAGFLGFITSKENFPIIPLVEIKVQKTLPKTFGFPWLEELEKRKRSMFSK